MNEGGAQWPKKHIIPIVTAVSKYSVCPMDIDFGHSGADLVFLGRDFISIKVGGLALLILSQFS